MVFLSVTVSVFAISLHELAWRFAGNPDLVRAYASYKLVHVDRMIAAILKWWNHACLYQYESVEETNLCPYQGPYEITYLDRGTDVGTYKNRTETTRPL
jgi:hypothetical protein